MRPIALANIGVQLLQEAVLSVLESTPADSMSTSDIAQALGLPHNAPDWHGHPHGWQYHLVKQLLFHMQRQQLVEDVRSGPAHQWVRR